MTHFRTLGHDPEVLISRSRSIDRSEILEITEIDTFGQIWTGLTNSDRSAPGPSQVLRSKYALF